MENAIQINQTKNKRNLDPTPKRNYNEAKDEEEVVEYHSSRRSAPQRLAMRPIGRRRGDGGSDEGMLCAGSDKGRRMRRDELSEVEGRRSSPQDEEQNSQGHALERPRAFWRMWKQLRKQTNGFNFSFISSFMGFRFRTYTLELIYISVTIPFIKKFPILFNY